VLKKKSLLRLMSFWPPYLGAGVRLRKISSDLREVEVELVLRFWNRNYVGTQFGGSLYSMTDPFYMLMLLENLGREFEVWDKAGSIRYRRPGRGNVRARFVLESSRLEEIRAQALAEGRSEPRFLVEIRDAGGELVAEVEKSLSVRPKKRS
jgi:acyl-coenzyme A thioesterase PaaI-like protein